MGGNGERLEEEELWRGDTRECERGGVEADASLKRLRKREGKGTKDGPGRLGKGGEAGRRIGKGQSRDKSPKMKKGEETGRQEQTKESRAGLRGKGVNWLQLVCGV